MQELEFKIVETAPSGRMGKQDIKIKMISLYDNGKWVKHLPLTDALAKLIKGKRIKIDD